MTSIAEAIEARRRKLDEKIDEYFELRFREVRLTSYLETLREDIRKKRQEKISEDFHLQMLQEAEWRNNHPMRDRATQVREFQLQAPLAVAAVTTFHQPKCTGEPIRVVSAAPMSLSAVLMPPESQQPPATLAAMAPPP